MIHDSGDWAKGMLGDDKVRKVDRDFDEGITTDDFEYEKNSRKKVFYFYLILAIAIIALFSKAFVLQIVQGKYYRGLAEGNRVRIKQVDSARGLVYDNSGKSLVENKPQFVLTLYSQDLPKNKQEREKIAEKISGPIEISRNDLMSKMKAYQNMFDPLILKDNIDHNTAIVLQEKISNYPCLQIEEKINRQYISDSALAPILGYIGKISDEELKQQPVYKISDYLGKTGLELNYEKTLKGIKGQQSVEVDASGKVARVLEEIDPKVGNSLVLGLNYDLQKKTYEILNKYKDSSKSRAAVAITMNPQTGEILSMVSLPSYDNNIFTLKSGDEFQSAYEALLNDPSTPLLDRAINGIYPPGSTIKPTVAAAALSEGTITPETTLFAPEKIEVKHEYDPNITYTFVDWKPGGHGVVNVYSAISQSCDVFFYSVGGGWQDIKGLGIKKINRYFELFGLGAKTGVDLPAENIGLVPDPKWKEKVKKEAWYLGDTYHVSIGQGDLLVTPLQLVNSIATIANGGNLMTPHFVDKITNVKGKVIKDQTRQVKKESIISKAVADVVRNGMRQTVTSGTARSLANMGIEVAGKTGTAQFENNESEHSWFTSFAPFNDPKIATVVLFEGGGEGYEVALPATREILEYYFRK